MKQQSERFSDVHAHAQSLRGWRQTYSQISAGTLNSSLHQLATRRAHLFREQMNQRVVQHGSAPAGQVCFALPVSAPGRICMQGREADDNSVFVLRGGDDFMFHMPTGMDLLSLTFDESLYDEVVAGLGSQANFDKLLRQSVIQVPVERLQNARRRMLAMFSEVMQNCELAGTPGHEEGFERAMLTEFLLLIADPSSAARPRDTQSSHSFIVDRCHQIAISDSSAAPSVIELCQQLHVSRRTVQNSFRNVAETTPLHYLRSLRLNGVRRELASTAPTEASIGDIAARWGFFHLSHFAADYHELFGELPSQTRRVAALACA